MTTCFRARQDQIDGLFLNASNQIARWSTAHGPQLGEDLSRHYCVFYNVLRPPRMLA